MRSNGVHPSSFGHVAERLREFPAPTVNFAWRFFCFKERTAARRTACRTGARIVRPSSADRVNGRFWRRARFPGPPVNAARATTAYPQVIESINDRGPCSRLEIVFAECNEWPCGKSGCYGITGKMIRGAARYRRRVSPPIKPAPQRTRKRQIDNNNVDIQQPRSNIVCFLTERAYSIHYFIENKQINI